MKKLVTAESVTKGHPDKICDQISDAILDQALGQDPNARVACEVAINNQVLVILGEVTVRGTLNYKEIARKVIEDLGYTDESLGFDFDKAAIYVAIKEQSADIALGVTKVNHDIKAEEIEGNSLGAGDQGLVVGYACDETENLMPLAIELAHKLTRQLDYVREQQLVSYFRPDGKAQVTLVYDENGPLYIDRVVISIQHDDHIQYETLWKDVLEKVVYPVLPAKFITKETHCHINPTGRFVLGGPAGDSGLTGRKIIVDTYGGYARHGGGAFSGKDPTKVDRSAAYMARYIAKNIVAAGLAKQCEVEIAYIIGRVEPAAVNVNTFGTGLVSEGIIHHMITQCFDLRVAAMINALNLGKPQYLRTAVYGHFGENTKDLSWENTDKALGLLWALLDLIRSGESVLMDLSLEEKEEIVSKKAMIEDLELEAQASYYRKLKLPPCPYCSSKNTAIVQVGIVSRSLALSSMTGKFHLRANKKPGQYYCNKCKRYF